ncbi:MAG: SDR family NAD(P)-dependent oxidoreductase [Alphaproteobacteria bacterium]
MVTGGAGMIGSAIVRALAAEGARVVILDRDAERGRAVVAAVAGAGGEAELEVVDFTQRRETDAGLRRVVAARGPAHMVVHAAVPPTAETETLFRSDDAAWDAQFEVGVVAARRLGRIFGEAMVRARLPGRFLFLTSLHAETPRNLAHYSTAKAAMTMLMREMARSLAPFGVRVNALAPGWIDKNWHDEQPTRAVPLRRVGRPEEVAAMATVMLSDRFSSYMTGSTVVLDGGLSLHSWIPLRN